ncbi:phospholipid scramblase 1-like [Lytechinus pictus]|uniref:phospholipid scramblase 1-like n=1 Tax=Lytechinus pictus TaxID=7653 RepID=UPI0030B9CFAA
MSNPSENKPINREVKTYSNMAASPNFDAIEMQPGKKVEWMTKPDPSQVTGCPPGLEYLVQIDQILIHQMVEIFEAVTNIEMKNKYTIKNSLGQQIFYAFEESSCCHRYWCRQGRGLDIHVIDNEQREVMKIVRPFQCCAGCCWCADTECCAYLIQIEAPPGNIIGYAKQTKSWWYPHMDVMDADMNPILKIRGPCCICQTICCRCDVEFKVMSNDLSSELGVIQKQWSGWLRECFTKADHFGMTFPSDLDVKAKATLMGALFLIEFMFFEQDQ